VPVEGHIAHWYQSAIEQIEGYNLKQNLQKPCNLDPDIGHLCIQGHLCRMRLHNQEQKHNQPHCYMLD
jgi:hypothetical protein